MVKEARPSVTAAWVAACRALDRLLPEDARLVHDPYGALFAGRAATLLERLLARTSGAGDRWPVLTSVIWIQIRTRVLDDVLRAFVSRGGRQVVLLGAGFDSRAARFAGALEGGRVFEVDHPATQSRKRRLLDAAGAHPRAAYLAWDFERDPMEALPAGLRALGHDPARPTLTIWEGVTMYLTEPAIDAALRTVAAYSAAASQLAVTYFDRAWLARPTPRGRLLSFLVARLGEPFRFGWDPAALPAAVAPHGFRLVWDRDDRAMAAELVPRHAAALADGFRHIALLERSP